jgi:hypothetical protein
MLFPVARDRGVPHPGPSPTTTGPDGPPAPDAPLDDGAVTATCTVTSTTGYHQDTCDGMVYDVNIPAACTTPGACGLIVDVHGLTMSGQMEDNNTNLRALGAQHGYVVIQPNANPAPPAAMFMPPGDDDRIYAFIGSAIATFGIPANRVHFTGFSDGGEMTFRFLCAHAATFSSVAAAGASAECFQAGQAPPPQIPLLVMNGTKDALVAFQTEAVPHRDAILAAWSMGAGTVIAQGTGYKRTRYTSAGGNVFEFLQHDYAAADNPILVGHCYPGSTDPGTVDGQLFPFGCAPPTAFSWGVEVIDFFMAHE